MMQREKFATDRSLLKGLLVGWAGLLGSACESTETKACLTEYKTAQESVLGVDAKSRPSVASALAVVEQTLKTCSAAQRHEEVKQLTVARNEFSAQVELLDRRARRKRPSKLGAEELAQLVKDGDPTCPRGQAYRPQGAGEIRCKGPQLVEMDRNAVETYFQERGYRVRATPTSVEAEQGSERYTFTYPPAPGNAPPSCTVLIPAAGTPWEEALSRATGVNPARMKSGSPLKLAHGAVPYAVDEKNVTVRVGACP